MTPVWIKVLKRAVCAALCYGMIFTYPSWTIFGRIAHANSPKAPAIVPTQGDMVEPPLPKAPPKPAAKPEGEKTHKGDDKPLSPNPKKTSVIPVGSNCADDNFYLGIVKGQGDIDVISICGSKQYNNAPVSASCWKQVFTLLGAAEANSYAMSSPDRPYASASAASAISNAKHFIPSVGVTLARHEDKLTKVLSEMSSKDNIKESNNQECCRQLVEKAQGVADYIVKGPKGNSSELDRAAKKKDDLYRLIDQKRQLCETGHAGAVVVAHDPPPPPPPPQKKKRGFLWAILIAIGVGLLIWALTRKKDKKAKPRPTEKPKPCKGKGCGGGGGGNSGGSSGGTGCATGNCGNTTGATTAVEPPATTGTTTYPSTTGDEDRETITGGTGGGTYPNDDNNDPGRDTTTGGTGTVTGSTTATPPDENPSTTTTGNTLPSGPDEDRDTDGTNRTLIK